MAFVKGNTSSSTDIKIKQGSTTVVKLSAKAGTDLDTTTTWDGGATTWDSNATIWDPSYLLASPKLKQAISTLINEKNQSSTFIKQGAS